ELFGLAPAKGDIRVGAAADLVLFDPEAGWTVDQTRLHERVDYTPYQGMDLIGRPVATWSRGELIHRDGEVLAPAGRGKYLHRH
ncbi:MAG: dihydropyrimidinase, partial [Planctomycetes bacterium]|nr:dihydropyrimidinase [Planctomycetota bacterium]